MKPLFACVAIVIVCAHAGLAVENPLLVSVRLAETQFKGWSYGHRMYRQQIDCVQFIAAVVEELLTRKLEQHEEEILFIKHVGRRQKLKHLIQQNDKRIKGIQTALVRMGKGEIVEPANAEPGDFVQFWRHRKGQWFGHTAIIVNVIYRDGRFCAVVFGAHQSLDGIGVGGFEVGLNDPNLKIYLVRFKS